MQHKGLEHAVDTFESGLRLVTVPMPSARTATVFALVACGSKYEPKPLNGISHFLEHMMFKGTERRPGYLDISRELDAIGASYNAFTSKEVTGYYAKAASSKTDVIMDVVFDIFLNSKLEQGAMEIERGAIIEELRMRRDDPQQHIARITEELLYGDQPAGWEIGGSDETVNAMQSGDLRSWFDTHYVAENTVIAVTGQIDADAVRAQAQSAFAHIRQAPKGTKPAVVEKQDTPQLLVMQKDVEQVYVQLALRAFDMHDDRRYALALLAQVLGGGMSSRLFDEVREKRGLAYYVNAGASHDTDTGTFEVGAGLNRAKATEGIRVILEELKRTADEGITALELQQVQDQAEGRLAFMMESTAKVGEEYGSSMLFYDKIITPEEEIERLKAVTRDDVRAVAEQVFQNNGLNLAVIGPQVDKDQFSEVLHF